MYSTSQHMAFQAVSLRQAMFYLNTNSNFSKQAYAPNSNVLVTKFLSERGVGVMTDLLVPRGANLNNSSSRAFLPWLIRKVESIRGTVPFKMECAPAFNYCRDKHTAEVSRDALILDCLILHIFSDFCVVDCP